MMGSTKLKLDGSVDSRIHPGVAAGSSPVDEMFARPLPPEWSSRQDHYVAPQRPERKGRGRAERRGVEPAGGALLARAHRLEVSVCAMAAKADLCRESITVR